MDPILFALPFQTNMNTPEHYAWLLNNGFLEPARLGTRHLLFSKEFSKGLINEVVAPSRENLKVWEGDIDRLIALLMKWSDLFPLWAFGVVEHDGCFAEVVWPHQLELPKFIAGDLAWLQSPEISDSPVVQIGITTAQADWLVLFERRAGLEIAFYGSDEKWEDFASCLAC